MQYQADHSRFQTMRTPREPRLGIRQPAQDLVCLIVIRLCWWQAAAAATEPFCLQTHFADSAPRLHWYLGRVGASPAWDPPSCVSARLMGSELGRQVVQVA
jgi:hypothetical protein